MLDPRPFAFVFVLASATLFTSQQPATTSPPQQPFGSGATAIVVDAIVRDGKGNPVRDLRKEDFELLEDGVRQQIGDVAFVGAPAEGPVNTPAETATPATAAGEDTATRPAPHSRSGPRFMALVFDRLSPEARWLAYKGAMSCVDGLQPDDYVAVYLSDLTLTMIQTYTNDPEKLRRALKDVASRATASFDHGATTDRLKDRDERGNLLPGDADPSVPVVASAESEGRPVDGRTIEVREIAAVLQATHSSWEAMARDQQGYATTNALIAVTSALGILPGRKTVVFFAEGLAISDKVLPQFRNVVATANRGNVSVYTIDAAGLRVHSKDAETGRAVRAMGAAGINGLGSIGMLEYNEDVLRRDPRTSLTLLADQTGGFLVENTNDLAKGMRRVDDDRRVYYLLTYTPKNNDFDGRWRTIAVRVPNRRVTVRARGGYLAVRTAAGTPMLAYEGPALAALDRAPAPIDVPLRAAAFVFPGRGDSRVAILASTDAAALRFTRDDSAHTYRSDFSIVARIVDARGNVVRKSSQPYRLSGSADQIDRAKRGEVLFFRNPSLAPGRYTLEVAVHDALASRSGVHRATFAVPDAPRGSLQVSDLVLVGRAERVADAERKQDNPLYVGDVLVYPNLGEPIRRGRDKAITFYSLILPAAGAAPSAELEVVRGDSVTRLPVSLPAADAAGRIPYIAQIPIQPLTPGTYVLRLTVSQGERKEVRDATFAIVE